VNAEPGNSTPETPNNPPQDSPKEPPKPRQKKALVYDETTGWRHDVIDQAYDALNREATKHGWQLTRTNDHFTDEQLSTYSVIIFFFTTTNFAEGKPDILRSEEKRALENFIAGGGGVVGVHSAADTYKVGSWPYYTELLGAEFNGHPWNVKQATVRFEDRNHPSTKHFKSNQWVITDEWYNYKFPFSTPRNELTVLATLDESTLPWEENDDHPIIWCHEYKGGRSWYTGMGHVDSNWYNSDFLLHIIGGMEWAGSFSS